VGEEVRASCEDGPVDEADEPEDEPRVGAVMMNEDQDLLIYDGQEWVLSPENSPSDGRTAIRSDE
jgi:hypothetical protein